MTTEFRINGTALGNDVTPVVPDPYDSRPFREGAEERTPNGKIRSLAWHGIEVMFDPMYAFQFQKLHASFLSLVAGGLVITSIRVPIITGYNTADPIARYWKTYSAFDSRGIWPDEPQGVPVGISFDSIVWRFRRVKPALVE